MLVYGDTAYQVPGMAQDGPIYIYEKLLSFTTNSFFYPTTTAAHLVQPPRVRVRIFDKRTKSYCTECLLAAAARVNAKALTLETKAKQSDRADYCCSTVSRRVNLDSPKSRLAP